MDLNFRRRRSDRAIAREVAEEFFKATKPLFDAGATDIARDLLARHFGLVCERHQLSETAATRIFGYVTGALADMQGELDDVGKKFAGLEQSLSVATHSR